MLCNITSDMQPPGLVSVLYMQGHVAGFCRFMPIVATVLAMRDLSRLLEAVLLHSESKQVADAWLMAAAHNGSAMLSSIDVFVRELSEITLICFM